MIPCYFVHVCAHIHMHMYARACVTIRLHVLAYIFTYVCVYSDCTVLGTVHREDTHVRTLGMKQYYNVSIYCNIDYCNTVQ